MGLPPVGSKVCVLVLGLESQLTLLRVDRRVSEVDKLRSSLDTCRQQLVAALGFLILTHVANANHHWGQTHNYPVGTLRVHCDLWNKVPSTYPPGTL